MFLTATARHDLAHLMLFFCIKTARLLVRVTSLWSEHENQYDLPRNNDNSDDESSIRSY